MAVTGPVDTKYNVLGTQVSGLAARLVAQRVIADAEAGKPCGVAALAVHGIIEAVRDKAYQARLNALTLVVPDGQPVRWALNLLHQVDQSERVYGPDLMLALCDIAERRGIGIYLFGSTRQTLADLTAGLQKRYPNLIIAGSQPSRFRVASADEQTSDQLQIQRSGARIVFVGLGCPRQEVWAYENFRALSMPVIGVGAAFDYHAGSLREPPRWMMRWGLQWLFRLCQEPARLWKRYLVTNTWFVGCLLLQLTGLKTFTPAIEKTAIPPQRPS